MMKLHYWGTAAAEGMPAVFCECENCKKARALGGKNFRARSQALLDETILIDMNPDTYMNAWRYGFSLIKLKHLLITHAHGDHFYPDDLTNRAKHFSYFEGESFPLTVYGSKTVTSRVQKIIDSNPARYENRLRAVTLTAFEPVQIEKYTVVPLPAVHGADPFVYQISADGKTFLYGNDSGIFTDDVFNYWKENGIVFDYVSLDCTEACRPITYDHHMNLERNIYIRSRMLQDGTADAHTRFCCNHFSHNGHFAVYEDFLPIAEREGFLVTYDGMTVEI